MLKVTDLLVRSMNVLRSTQISKPVLFIIALTGFLVPIPYQYILLPKSLDYNKYQAGLFDKMYAVRHQYMVI